MDILDGQPVEWRNFLPLKKKDEKELSPADLQREKEVAEMNKRFNKAGEKEKMTSK